MTDPNHPTSRRDRVVIVDDIADSAAPTMAELENGHDVTGRVVDESAARAYREAALARERAQRLEEKRRRDVEAFERNGSKLAHPNGYRRMGKRRKRELRGLRELFGPTLVERSGAERARRRTARRGA